MNLLLLRILFAMSFVSASLAHASSGLRTLYLTDFSNVYHDYEATQNNLQRIVQDKLNLDMVFVGKTSQESLDLLKKPDFLRGYQLFIYNACFADLEDLSILRNINREIAASGVPTVFLHCAMHNFRWSSTKPGVFGWGRSSRLQELWGKTYPNEQLPAFWQLTGMDTVSHDWIRSFEVSKTHDHPITRMIPQTWTLAREERYRTLQMADDAEVLLESGPHAIAWLHRFGKARIFATTLGHDEATQNDPNFAELLTQAIAFITGT
jgi:hypothetical protein